MKYLLATLIVMGGIAIIIGLLSLIGFVMALISDFFEDLADSSCYAIAGFIALAYAMVIGFIIWSLGLAVIALAGVL
jgi:hypothetical protein